MTHCIYKLFFIIFISSHAYCGDGKTVYLATYPRSGNTWTRGLIEEASGIATKSVYCFEHVLDVTKRLPKENETVLVKTHDYFNIDSHDYIGCIRIVRHPVDSFYSYSVWLHEMNNFPHGNEIGTDHLIPMIKDWKAFNTYWDAKENVTTFRYEDMLENPYPFLIYTMQLCEYTYTDADIMRSIDKYPAEGNPLKHLSNFTRDQLDLINNELGDIMARYNYYNY